ncbi:MAG: response regulator transcription factor [Anabaena sp. CoA2_C59]|jgi:DNA-binding NarL/FixJ family response regulator|uniref:LuxR family transcriptional regulator n=1 Tax=Aphanizomenon flos-aquae WA102 TaxID=1710896 RepID=A0A1B7X1C4_APHFL|nr:response regulator transcription factor [Aphanizomenon flos-aquae Clear-A1]MCE2905600.1 response regulator transcription factor [Anabaena sp. CoA2_C59]MDJ0505345.1 response regulator transcription factor [Nostocales cyanobacterium LE14-WE12]OBQ20408.1 MAG: LuxR family transcriptional regulator [Anabaena sp. WA113]OBQ30986.1 MAG: LuxR family transcriptional regulator [Aphanizomenon flos-aquae MDT14a]OBQ43184.1 MAG: LuxR family transcriptional regulator [Aphanizomenon flos-aquae WA102]QSV667
MITILIVDDQNLIRQGLKALLELESDMKIVGEAENGQIAINLVRELQPNVILMDIRMPIMDGVAATKEINNQFPHCKILILTTFDDDEYVKAALQNGAMGYLLKDTPSEELAVAIRAVNKGYSQLGPGIVKKLITQFPANSLQNLTSVPANLAELTPREKEVLRLIAIGNNNREIAQKLYISEGTVKNHITNILNRLNLRDRTQAAILANSFFNYL